MGRLVCDVSNFASFSCEVPIQKFAFLTSCSLRKWCSYTLLKLSRAGLLRKVALPSRAIPYSFDTQVTLILILIDVQYSQNAVFTFGKDLNHQNHSSSGSHHQVEKSPPSKISDSPYQCGRIYLHSHPLPLFGKPCHAHSTSKWWLLQIVNVIIWKSSVIKLINKINGIIPYRYQKISVFNSPRINLSIPSYFRWIIWKITGNQKNLKHFGHFSWVHQLIPSPEPNLKNYGSIWYWPKRYFSWKNGTKNFNNPYSIPSLSVLHQNKFLHNFHKRRQHLIVGHIKGLY